MKWFCGKANFMSNFYPSPIMYEGQLYSTVEHAFQAAKTTNSEQKEEIHRASTPGKAKRLGKKVSLRTNWANLKRPIMLELLRLKFTIPELREQLLATGEEELVEVNTWGDVYWGKVHTQGVLVGENYLGRILMQVRKELK